MYFGEEFRIRYMIGNYFLSFCGWPFHSGIYSNFGCTKFKYFPKVHLVCFSSVSVLLVS